MHYNFHEFLHILVGFIYITELTLFIVVFKSNYFYIFVVLHSKVFGLTVHCRFVILVLNWFATKKIYSISILFYCAYRKEIVQMHNRFCIVFTNKVATYSVVWLQEHSTGLTQNMLTSASFSQKPIKLTVGSIIQHTSRARWWGINTCSARGWGRGEN